MELEQQNFVKPTTEWNKKDKENLLNGQKLTAGLGIFFSIVLCTNLFLINARSSNHLSLGFGVVSLLLCIAHVVNLYWALHQTNKVRSAEDAFAENTDNFFTRLILFIALLLLVTFTTFFIIYSFSKQDLLNEFMANHEVKDQTEYAAYIDGKVPWVNFLSYANILFLLYTIFTSYALASSPITSRLLIYLIGSFLVISVFYEFVAIDDLFAILKFSNFELTSWVFSIIKSVKFLSVILLFVLAFTYLANARRLRIAYLILGTFFLATCAIQIPITGQLFRDYNALTNYYDQHCQRELGDLEVGYIESLGCKNKYQYADKDKLRAACTPVNAKPEACFEQPTCSKRLLYKPWEKDLVKDPVVRSITACLNGNCCGMATNVYSRPLLKIASLSLVSVFLCFILAAFSYNLSAKDKGDKQLNKVLQAVLLIIFGVLVISGIFWAALASHPTVPRRDIIMPKADFNTAAYQTIKIEEDSTLTHYPTRHRCEHFSTIIKPQPDVLVNLNANAARAKDTGILYKWDPSTLDATPVGTPKIDLNGLQAKLADGTQAYLDNDQCKTGCKRPGFIVLVRSPLIDTTNIKDKNQNYHGYNTDISGQFFYLNEQEKNHDQLRLISSASAGALMYGAASTVLDFQKFDLNTQYHYFGLIGQQNTIEKVLTDKLHVCNYNVNDYWTQTAANFAKFGFFIRVIKVDLTKYGFTAVVGGAKDVPPATHARLLTSHKLLPKHTLENKMVREFAPKQHHNAAAAAGTFFPAKTQAYTFRVRVHDFVNDEAIQGAAVSYFELRNKEKALPAAQAATTATYIEAEDYDYTCNIDEFTDPELNFNQIQGGSITDSHGSSDLEFIFNLDAGQEKVVNLIIFASAPGYAHNCRALRFSSSIIKKQKYLDIGLSKLMKKGQARVVLEWSRYNSKYIPATGTAFTADATFKTELIDLDLYTTFTSINEGFSCHIGHILHDCGGLKYHGDSSLKKIGVSSEAITFETIGRYDYLVYLGRYVADFEKLIKEDQTTNFDTKTQQNQKFLLSLPVIKYFAGDSERVQAATTLKQLLPALTNGNSIFTELTTIAATYQWTFQPTAPAGAAKKFWFDGTQKFFLLPMCVRATINDQINPYRFSNVVPATPTGFALGTTTYKKLPTIWSNYTVNQAADGTGTPILNSNYYTTYTAIPPTPAPDANTAVMTNDMPNTLDTLTIFTLTDQSLDKKKQFICDGTTIINEWTFDKTAVAVQ